MYNIFISYRRSSGANTARLIKFSLEQKGFSVFLDVDNLEEGHFDERLLRYIETTDDFIIILSGNSLERTKNSSDWIRKEVAHAVAMEKNIIPVFLEEFQTPRLDGYPKEIRQLMRHNGIQYSHIYYDAMIKRLLELLVCPLPNTEPLCGKVNAGNQAESDYLTDRELQILRYLKGKSDIACTALTIFNGIKDKSWSSFVSLHEVAASITTLLGFGYLQAQANDEVAVTDRAKSFYGRQNRNELNLSDISDQDNDDPLAALVEQIGGTLYSQEGIDFPDNRIPEIHISPPPGTPVSITVYEEDTNLILSSKGDILEIDVDAADMNHSAEDVRAFRKLPGSIVFSGNRWYAVVIDLNAETICTVEWIKQALSKIMTVAAERKIKSLALPLLGSVHGPIDPEESMYLTLEAINQSPCSSLHEVVILAEDSFIASVGSIAEDFKQKR